jgi:glucokinase
MTEKRQLLLGFDIGGTKAAVCVGTPDGEILGREQFATGLPGPTVQRCLHLARELAARLNHSWQDLAAAGISCGGPLSSAEGLVLSPPNLPGWDAVPVVRIVQDATGLPTRLENDANAGALAEWRFGAGRGYNNIIFLTAGTGMGAGLILDGRLYRGRQDLAGEVGHIRLADSGPVGYGKAGSFEGFCSGGGIAELARSTLAAPHEPSRLDRVSTRDLTARDVAEAAIDGDPVARQIIQASGRMLGRGLALLIDCLNPELIIIGSLARRLGDLWLAPALEVVRAEALPLAWQSCQIVPAGLGESIGDLAALAVAMLAAEG